MADSMSRVAIVGGGPAGLMAAQALAEGGVAADVFDAMPSVGRKFLLAGKGGLNLTHSEPLSAFVGRYGARQTEVARWLADLDPAAVRSWAESLGVQTFVGTSGRVFPTDMKAAPLLRAWMHRLRTLGVRFHMRHRWLGWSNDGALRFQSPQGESDLAFDACILAMGGASWPRLGSDGNWVALLQQRGVSIAPLQAANCGFDVMTPWSPFFASRFAGQPFKSVALRVGGVEHGAPPLFHRKGEFVATATGVEGSLIYAASSLLRDTIAQQGSAAFELDLLPDVPHDKVLADVRHPRGSRSLTSHLKSRLGLDGIKTAVLFEVLGKVGMQDPARLGAAVKALPMVLARPRPVVEAISTAGGVRLEDLNAQLMVNSLPGVFCAGEMLDWEAPTGGYLLTACLASGLRAGHGALSYLRQPRPAVVPPG
ncbi:MAG: hypothetical protein RLZZ126_1453 [Pseudomonadota bacterium]|jgi:uncharacterized flavoprotein (TIGR03862 family)